MDKSTKQVRLRARVAPAIGIVMVAAAAVAVFNAAPADSSAPLAKVIGSSIGVDPAPGDGEK